MSSILGYRWLADLEFPLDDEQRDGLAEYAAELMSSISKYQILPDQIDRDLARKISLDSPGKIFSVESDWATPSNSVVGRVGFWLVNGFFEHCDDYYIGEVEAPQDPGPYPYTEIHLRCVVCNEEGISPGGIKCQFCDGSGSRLFDLTWDRDFRVYASEVRLYADVSVSKSPESAKYKDPELDQYLVNRTKWNKEANEFFAERFDLESIEGGNFLVARLREHESHLEKQELFYFMVGNAHVYLDVPFAKIVDIPDISHEFCHWGLGKFRSAITYHTTLPTSAFSGDITLVETLINQMLEDAKKAESRIYS